MAQQNIGVGDSPNRGSGDRLRDAFIKANANFNDLYSVVGGSSLTLSANKVIAGPDGSNGQPSARSLVAADFGTAINAGRVLAGPTSGTASSPSFRNLVGADFGSTVTANLVFAGATSGGVSSPAFRSLVNADLQSQAGLSTGVYTAGVVQMTISNQGLITVVDRNGPGSGVTSVGFSANPIFTVSGSPITASSTIELHFANQSANTVLAAGSSPTASSAPSFRNLVARDFGAGVTANVILAGATSGGVSSPSFRNLVAGDFGAGVTANIILAGPLTGAASSPSFRGLTAPDLPNLRYNAQTSGYGLTSADRFTLVDYTGTSDGSWSAIDAATVGIGHLVTVHNSSASGQLVVDGHSTQLIETFTAITLLPKQSLRLMTINASTWAIAGGGSYLIRQTVDLQAEGWISRTAQGATDSQVELGSSIVVKTKDFDPGTNWFIQKDFTLPDSFFDGGPLTARYKASIASGSGLGVMGIQAIAYGSNSSLNIAFGAAITQGLTFVSGNTLTNSGAASAPFVPAGTVAAGQTLKLQVFRDAGTASDTLGTNLRLHEVILEFDAIKFGSDY